MNNLILFSIISSIFSLLFLSYLNTEINVENEINLLHNQITLLKIQNQDEKNQMLLKEKNFEKRLKEMNNNKNIENSINYAPNDLISKTNLSKPKFGYVFILINSDNDNDFAQLVIAIQSLINSGIFFLINYNALYINQ